MCHSVDTRLIIKPPQSRAAVNKTKPPRGAQGLSACRPGGLHRDLLQHLVWIGVLAGIFFGVNQFTIDRDLVNAPTRWYEGDLLNGFVVIVKDLFRQTGGFCEVASRGAVFDGDVTLVSHGDSLLLFMMAMWPFTFLILAFL